MIANIEQEVRKRAYELWLRDGMSFGRDVEHWCTAEKEILSRQNAGPTIEIIATKPAPAPRKARVASRKKK
jgi:hypothetical protein